MTYKIHPEEVVCDGQLFWYYVGCSRTPTRSTVCFNFQPVGAHFRNLSSESNMSREPHRGHSSRKCGSAFVSRGGMNVMWVRTAEVVNEQVYIYTYYMSLCMNVCVSETE